MRKLRHLLLFLILPLLIGAGCDKSDTTKQTEFSNSNHHFYWLHDLQHSNDTLLHTFLSKADSTATKPINKPQENLPYQLNIASYLKLVVESILEQDNLADGKKTWQATLEYLNYPQDVLDYIKTQTEIPEDSKDRLTKLIVNRLDKANKKKFKREQICLDLLLLQDALLTDFEVSQKEN